ncbi:MAG: DNA polymerase I [Pelagibacteraceae bacterium TMED237]|nr:MAG: DNA polymerase I [Pelagibacteraceae bacterium TMED237]|tara:strand:- start:8177 stop:10918 length:2742 start_codon:yes stop_codon:yes gene_type:complete
MNKKSRLILVDGSAYIFRAYYGLPPMNRPDGTPINAVFGFTNMLVKLIEDYNEDKMIVIFDAARENFRNNIYPEYKANRGAAPDDLIPQFPLIRECVKSFNIPQLEIEGYEADDLIATYSKLAKKDDIETIIVSSDKDLMQLVDKKVTMLDPMKNKIIEIKDVEEKFGVKPEKVIYIQALTGDKVDNIPGAPGIGPKTASQLINEYNDINGLFKNLNKIKQEKRKNILAEAEKDIRVSLELVNLKSDIELPLTIKNIKTYKELKNQKNNIYQFLKEQGFKSTSERLKANSFISNSNKGGKTQSKTEPKYILLNSKNEFEKVLKEIEKKGFCAIDTETNSLNIENAKLVGISLCFDESKSYYIPINHQAIDSEKKIENQLQENYVVEKINSICSDESILKIGQNIKYDMRILKKYGVSFKSIADTMLISYSIDNGIYKHNLDDLSFNHFNHTTIKYKDIVGTGKNEITFDKVLIDDAVNYAAEDSLLTLKLFLQLYPRLIKERGNFVYNNIDLPLINVLSKIEENGIEVNKSFLTNLSNEFELESKKLEKNIYKLSKEEFNIGSPKQLGEMLFINLKIKGGKKTKSGSYSTDSSTLNDLAAAGYDIAKLVLEWRELTKLKSTYTDALFRLTDHNSRVHTSFGLANTLTGRLSSTDPNLQNIPIRTENGKKIRTAFISKKENSLVSFDYSQIELRLAAEISGDKNFIKAFKNNEDIHASTAREIFNLKDSEIDNDFRRKAKAINFGILYGISPYGLAKQLAITNSEAKEYINEYFDKYPNIKKYMDNQIDFAKTNHYVETIFKRKINIRGIADKNFAVRGFAERQAINAPIQGSAADIIKLAMIRIHNEIEMNKINGKMLLQVHDELIFEVHNKRREDLINQVKQIMETVHLKYKDFSVPLTVDFGFGDNWGQAH